MRRMLVLAALAAAPPALAAQVPASSARSLAMGGSLTALARGYEAVAWNPAQLATPRQPNVSIGLAQGQVEVGNNAFSIGDILDYADKTLSDADKQYLLSRIVNDDSTLAIRGLGGVGALAVSVGTLAFSLSSNGYATAAANRDMVEFAFNGNGAFVGTGNFFSLLGSRGNAWAATTLAGSYAMRFPTPVGRLAAGVTVKRVWGNFLGLASDNGSQVSSDSVDAVGQSVYTDYAGTDFGGFGNLFGDAPGSGWGVDLGGTLELSDRLQVSAVLVNAVGGMSWKSDRLRYDQIFYTVNISASGVVSDTTGTTTLTGAAIDGNPQAAALRDTLLANADFARLLRGGVAYRMGGVTLGGDVQLRLSEGLDRNSDLAIGGGAEIVLFGFLPLRGGLRTNFDDATAITGGTGLHLGPFALDLSGAAILGSRHPGVIVGAGMGLTF